MSDSGNAIVVKDLYKTFKLPHEQHSGLKQKIVGVFSSERGYELQKVLSNISFDIKKGEFFGIVGRNGSGKSTLLKLLAGIYAPDKGLVQVNGSLTPFIELGVGFNPELTGRENVYMNGALLGFDRHQMDKMYDEIVEFAEIEKFMDQKLKNYSSGMQVRLAFSIAIRAQSDILLLDEVLAVGDAIFQRKCYDYFKKLKKDARTVIFVSHDTSALQEYCDKGILVEKGEIVYEGKIEKVINKYVDILTKQEEERVEQSGDAIHHLGTGHITIEEAKIFAAGQVKKSLFTERDEYIKVEVTYKVHQDIEEPIYGITIFDSAGQRIFVTNNLWDHQPVSPVKKDENVRVVWDIPNIFNTGTFTVTPAVAGSGGSEMFDQVDDAITFKIRKKNISNAFVNIPHDMKVWRE